MAICYTTTVDVKSSDRNWPKAYCYLADRLEVVEFGAAA